LAKFDSKADEGIFLSYSLHGRAYRAYNKRTMLVEESMHIAIDETNQNMQESPKTSADDEVPNVQQVDNNLDNKSEETSKLPEIQPIEQGVQPADSGADENTVNSGLPKEWRVPRNLSLDNVNLSI